MKYVWSTLIFTALTAAVVADPIVDIYENDGIPGEGSSTELGWDYEVKNLTSNPPDKITYVEFNNLYSTAPPATSPGPGWSVVITPSALLDHYEIMFTANSAFFYINAGRSKSFGIITFRPPDAEVAIGDLEGIAGFQTIYGDIADTFSGPVGLVVRGDIDHDGDIDLDDFTVLNDCLEGPNIDVSSNGICQEADLDGDSDVDLQDFQAWTTLYPQ